MTNRPAGGARSKRWEPAPYDWYCDGPRVVEQLLSRIDFGTDLIWDPCVGRGNILDVAQRWGHKTVGSDIIDRHSRHRFFRGNILTQVAAMPRLEGRNTSVITNPPFSYEKDVAERIITHLLDRYDLHRIAVIVPVAFLNSQDRWQSDRLLRKPPSHVCFFRERHTMPPGHLIDSMTSPFAGGMADYVAIVWTRPHRFRTEAIWLPPGHQIPRPKATTKGECNAA